jgi:hypothetical protein
MATDERKDRENETTPESKISDLEAKKLSKDEEANVKGGAYSIKPTQLM